MEEMVNLFVQNGLAVVIIAYFLYKDYKFNEQIIATLERINTVLAKLETWHAKGDKETE